MPRPLLPPSAANSHHAPHRKLQAAHLRLRQLQPHFSNNTANPLHHQTHESEAIVESHPSSSMNKSSWTQSTNLCMRENKIFFFFESYLVWQWTILVNWGEIPSNARFCYYSGKTDVVIFRLLCQKQSKRKSKEKFNIYEEKSREK